MSVESVSRRPLVVRFGALGDLVILTVLIRHLYARFGQPVDILASGGWAKPLLQDQPSVGDIYVIRSRNTPYWLSKNQHQVVKLLRERGPSATWLCDHENEKTKWLLKRAGWNEQHWCHYANLPDVPGPHFCDLYLRFAYRNPPLLGGTDLPINSDERHGQLHTNDKQRAELKNWLDAKGLADQRLILIQPGNKRTMRRGFRKRPSNTKYWPEANWANVLRSLRETHPDYAILLLGVPQESELNDDILQLASIHNVYNVAKELPLPRLIALCEAAVGMISVDTGPAHIAASVGTNVVTLFGTANPALYAPRGPGIKCICLTGMKDGKPSMIGITCQQVLDAWIKIIS